MAPSRLFLSCLILLGCSTQEDRCFEVASRPYAAALRSLAAAEHAAETGYRERDEQIPFVDVSECGPTLEDRAICSDTTSVILPRYEVADRVVQEARAQELRAVLPALRTDAQRAYSACMLSGQVK